MDRNDGRRLPAAFYRDIEEELAAHPDGVGEYDLIQALKSRGYFDFLPPSPVPPHDLFRAHFILFHALYELRDRWFSSGAAYLEISPVRIRNLPYRGGTSAVGQPDRLRAYYLDWSNLEATTAADVDRLIASFWDRFHRLENRAEALAQLGLADPVDDRAIKQAYRKLVMEHHPDRGGDNERLQTINAAVNILLK